MSSEQRVSLQAAWVLHHRPYRDTSQIADLLTRDHGRVGVVARGSRRRGRRRMLLEPFHPLLVSWSGGGDLRTLISVETRGEPLGAAGQRRLSMFYLNELLLRLLRRHDPHPETFDDYERALQALAGEEPAAPALRYFERRLLQAMGYGLNLTVDVDGRPVASDSTYEYRLEAGAAVVPSDQTHGLVVAGRSLLELEGEALQTPQGLRDARRLLQAALALYLGEKPLRSRQVMLAMRARAPNR